jgi:hypothetical protein
MNHTYNEIVDRLDVAVTKAFRANADKCAETFRIKSNYVYTDLLIETLTYDYAAAGYDIQVYYTETAIGLPNTMTIYLSWNPVPLEQSLMLRNKLLDYVNSFEFMQRIRKTPSRLSIFPEYKSNDNTIYGFLIEPILGLFNRMLSVIL